ncbi:hypothetical protein VTL71DRAFT_1156 [Oculimacula yallundae]|uniref:Uncharacterized protein n=1 Tax=Oculimacula yallundae TaxID=86028 RepID=A0ABR4D224_9HELO
MSNTIASCPTWTVEEATNGSHGHIIRGMKTLSFPKFGFVIYRCTYSDDVAWKKLLTLIKEEAQTHIEELGPGRNWLGSHLEWTVIEDPILDGASHDEVKMRFDKWADENVVESERTSRNVLRWLPRFNYCVVVDEKCLVSLERSESTSKAATAVPGKEPPVFLVLMRAPRGIPAWMGGGGSQRRRLRRLSDGDSVDETEQDLEDEERRMREEEQEEEDEIEHRGDTPEEAWEATWMFVEPRSLLSLYNTLHSDTGWQHFYVRPPGVYGRGEC